LVGFARAPLVRFDPFSTQDPIARFVGRLRRRVAVQRLADARSVGGSPPPPSRQASLPLGRASAAWIFWRL